MNTYIALLRGINVAGKNNIKMDKLRSLFEELGYTNAATYLQSGNVIFKSNESSIDKLTKNISQGITRQFGYKVAVIILTLQQIEAIINDNPLLTCSTKNIDFLHVTFFQEKPNEIHKDKVLSKKEANEEVLFADVAIYLYCPNGYGKTKLNNTFLEKTLQTELTTRNWKTTVQLLTIAKNVCNAY